MRLWRVPSEEETAAAAERGAADAGLGGAGAAPSKRRRTGAGAEALSVSPLAAVDGHAGCVSSLLWPEPSLLVSGGWDCTVRCWDVGGAAPVPSASLSTTGAVLCLTAPTRAAPGAGLIALGSADRQVRVWDPRAGSSSGAAPLLGTHGGFVSAVRWCPTSAHHVLSASHDGSLRVWDLRSRVPLHTLAADDEGGKILAADWVDGDAAVVSGGTDCRLSFHNLMVGAVPAGGGGDGGDAVIHA